MRKVLTVLKPSQSRETEPMLDGQGSTPPYISINSNDASTSCISIEESATVTCPTCRGTGRIPRGQEKELVALIPYSDQRLKPRRTKLYVALAVSCCILVFFLVVFFLYPRSVTLYHAGVNSSVVTYDTTSLTVTLHTTNKLNISNNNLFGIDILSLNVEVLHMAVVVGTLTLKEVKKIGPLTTEQGFLELFLPWTFGADTIRRL
ncbi:transmembrane protein 106A isoform X2 [Dendrobates tinctorius]|uniref:transmembrane protein 106A isoform X2 n=1 Tax=Dendrobates tinctorius TaxID=92724 RepID=UPI003CCA55D5